MTINSLCKKSHKNAKEKGFWDNRTEIVSKMWESGLFSEDEIEYVVKAIKAQMLMLITSELGEALEADRKNKFGLEKKDTFEDEIADVFIRLGDMCGGLKTDIEKQIKWKMGYNSKRERLHGKKF
jgi:NTP pyrophosphatase (non-canonical NTP hydrolase)